MFITEHFALQGLHFPAISGTLMALSLLGNALKLGSGFVVTALIVASTLIFLGTVTFTRELESAV